MPSPKGSPLRRSNASNPNSPKRQVTEEQWIDGPRLSKAKVAEARHLMREVRHVKQCETWVDGPRSPAKSLVVSTLPGSPSAQPYGYMDSHKKSMIRQWVENQSNQVLHSPQKSGTPRAAAEPPSRPIHLAQFKTVQSDDEEICIETFLNDIVNPITQSLGSERNVIKTAEISIRMGPKTSQDLEMERLESQSERSAVSSHRQNDSQEDEDQDSGPSEVPPALPLLEPLGSREISHDSLHMMCSRHVSRESLGINIQTIDCGLQVTEEEIARTMGW